jgi:hypothetical protein
MVQATGMFRAVFLRIWGALVSPRFWVFPYVRNGIITRERDAMKHPRSPGDFAEVTRAIKCTRVLS